MRLISLTAIALAFPPALMAQDGSLLERVRAAMQLPVLTTEAREAGVPAERVSTTIRDIFGSGVPAGDASRILDEEVRTVREGGSTDNFGSYVRSQVDAGLRGRDLADAIHREHARRGMGRPGDAGRPEQGRMPRAGQPDDTARPAAGRPAQAGGRGQGSAPMPRQDSAARGRRP
jgi:hypothetical protein